MPGDRAVPELVEASGEAGYDGFEVLADLAVEGGALLDQVAAMADQELQGGPGLVAGGFEQGAAVAGIDRLTVLLGDEGVQDARLEAGGGEGALDKAVIAASAFDGDEAVVELVGGKGMPDLGDRSSEVGTIVVDLGGWEEDAAVEVGEQELGASLGAVEADDAEVFGPDQLDARMEHPPGLTGGDRRRVAARAASGT